MSELLIMSVASNPILAERARKFVANSFVEMGSSYQPEGMDSDLSDVEATYISNGGQFYIGLEYGTVVATSAVKRVDDQHAEIKRIRVAEASRSQGFGALMLNAALEWATVQGYTFATLDTQAANQPALSLFDSFGFQEEKRLNNKVIMSKRLQLIKAT